MYTEPQKIVKVVRIGTIMLWHHRAELPTDIFCKIEFRADNRLSITGVIGPRKNGDAWGGCGQIDMEFDHRNPSDNDPRYSDPILPSDITFSPGWDADLWCGFLNIWKRWHLNDMKAACEHQEIMGITYHKNPKHVCPVCGYKIGSAWKRRNVPQAVIEFLVALPDTDKTPAWV